MSMYLKAFVAITVCTILCVLPAHGGHSETHWQPANIQTPTPNALLESQRFIQIPGPNPILKPGPEGAWDDGVAEASDAFKDVDTYYFYYHATGAGKGYRLGVASSNHPLGPFKKHGDKPILDLGPEGDWDDKYVACAMVLKEARNKYLMWYSGYGELPEYGKWSIGLATAEHPAGPWKKIEQNPILEDFGYVGGVLKIKGKYRLYSAWPISSPGYKGDYSPLALATAEKPEGPYTKHPGNPLMKKGDFGDWDDGGISEAEVLYHNGAFHMFYGGTHLLGPRLESIGYAYSLDGYNFVKYARNPVAARQANPNAAAFAEVHAIIEPPFIYLYHTLRYEKHGDDRFPWFEDLGVQILVTQRPFSLNIPALNIESLDAKETTSLADCPPICLGHVNRVALTAECTYAENAERPIKIHVRASFDGMNYDTVDLYTFENNLNPGQTVRKTFELDPKVSFIKILVENQDRRRSVSSIKITAALAG